MEHLVDHVDDGCPDAAREIEMMVFHRDVQGQSVVTHSCNAWRWDMSDLHFLDAVCGRRLVKSIRLQCNTCEALPVRHADSGSVDSIVTCIWYGGLQKKHW